MRGLPQMNPVQRNFGCQYIDDTPIQTLSLNRQDLLYSSQQTNKIFDPMYLDQYGVDELQHQQFLM
jgi:hypothetical protein